MRLKHVYLATALLGSILMLSPVGAGAQQRSRPRTAGPASTGAAQPRSGQPPAAQPRSTQPRSGQPPATQPRSGQPPAAQPRSAQPRSGQPAAAQPRSAQPRSGQARIAQPRTNPIYRYPFRPYPGRYVSGYGYYGSYWGPSYLSLTWGHPRWWFPWGLGPYWYGPYWYGYGYDGYSGYYDDDGSLKLDVKPKDAEVFVDGYYAGRVDDFDGVFQSLRVAPGAHTVTLWCKGYKSLTQQVYVQTNETMKVHHQLEPLAAGESQEPRPVPPPEAPGLGAGRDDYPQPEPPAPPDAPRPRRPLPPPPPDEPRQPGQLAPPARVGETPDYSRLTVRVQPAGAQVFIDGEAWQTSPGADRLVVHLPIGLHHVEVRKDGFRTFKADVQIRSGETTTLNVSLTGQDGPAS